MGDGRWIREKGGAVIQEGVGGRRQQQIMRLPRDVGFGQRKEEERGEWGGGGGWRDV